MDYYNLALLDFGNVGRALVRLLLAKADELRDQYAIAWKITGVASRRLGWCANPDGFDPQLLLDGNFQPEGLVAPSLTDWLSAARPDVLFENTSLNAENGEPAISHIRAALEGGAHAITANKGPVVHAYRELRELARARRRSFLFEATVMGGAPIFSLFREALPATRLRRLRGILNSTTNLILSEMEAGLGFEQAVKGAQDLGIAETDPSADIDGWDAAVKVAALVTVLMGVPLRPQDVQRQGIRGLDPSAVRAAREAGQPYKLLCTAELRAGDVVAIVAPEQIPLTDPLAHVRGASSMVEFQTDTIHRLTISEQDPDVDTTAFGLLADFIRAGSPG